MEFVVERNFRLQRTLRPAAFISRVIRARLTCNPSSARTAWTRGAP
ncbi:hypothetical protein BOO71_0006541 [Deinococcus marmoris]|uniref:Uncharacterized protein n=1 Tax=Deinococcus marmoris TaxID=249408 RepID=A0A1U7NZ59_9DEIO|nr:hypothetical protein BOO71_0006541 [Deinococcus marmoris]